ncbi:hypothetical protein AVEN_47203-1 [Araneus ventricosus]|uniref:RNase H type-1 domain-containing protein n=1 Tax=Araneus ventricosus TaxID=182803 RepID=A0A4Y2HP34_ARAVE|nr:hypothetical protein AVEN_47203-1 [Araneus ventricosus]
MCPVPRNSEIPIPKPTEKLEDITEDSENECQVYEEYFHGVSDSSKPQPFPQLEACTWTSQSNQPIKLWTDSESSLHSVSSLKNNSPLAQDIQNILLNSSNFKLGWIKAHVGHAGNEAADLLAKKATLKGIPTQYPAPRSFLKKRLQAISTQLWQNQWDNGDLGRNAYLSFQMSRLPSSMVKTRNHVCNGTWPIPSLA